ncbi:TetR/AcrR family transcriptional regulator [Kribbella sp. CA-293567]|uniref:TetR/AcrR family transcriptional regulator n=1 Tax=Kribbella sp. CA-293567 TaxID=3002436 RepID=UPI0022DDDD29|nr:TetR/AcrR family transcriptional regulator [Kribbella sp. CA-293567]WBQ03334.1 TetR/AcrR family transcriptional regulator [Kribbella sp. CA-293567]
MSAVTSPLAWEHVQPAAARRLLTGAIEAFAERGFQATTTRDIASRADMSPAALYVHYPSKERLLFEISLYGHRAALEILSAADTAGTPTDRLRAMVAAFTAWHAEHHTIARVVQYELAALSPEHFAEVATIRRAISALIEKVLTDGVSDGTFAVPDVPGTTLALLSLSIDVARWYDPSRRPSPESLGATYADLAHRMVKA